jgi:chromosomal replication initiator protein
VERSVRELEGVVCKLAALSAAEVRAPDREMALLALRELGYLREGPLSLEEVLEAVIQRTNQDADEIRSSKRHASLVRTRHIAMYLAKHLTTHSLSEIGRYFGNRDHSTVLHAERKVSNDAKLDEQLRLELQALRRILGR